MPKRIACFEAQDVAGAGYTFGRYGHPIQSPKYLKTTGSSTTVSELNATDNTFQGFGVGDIIEVRVDYEVTSRTVTSIAGVPDSVTVGSAVNWENGGAGRAFSYRRFESGTGDGDGWIGVSRLTNLVVSAELTTFNVATSVDVTVQGRIKAGSSASPITALWTKAFTAIGTDFKEVTGNWDEIRVGVKLTGADTGTNIINIYLKGEPKEARP